MNLANRGNGALTTNPPAGDQHLSVHGSDWLWAVFAVFAITSIIVFPLTWRARAGEKIFHYLFTIALLSGAVAYFSMASDLAWSVIPQVNNIAHSGLTRQIFFAKYVYWVISFPVLIIAIGFLSSVSWATILYNIALAWVWILSYLFSAYTHTNYKWGFFAIGTVAYLALAFSTLAQGHRGARRMGYSRDHAGLAGWMNLIWFFYPIAFGLSDGGNRIGITSSFIFFGILDLLLVPLLAFAFIFLARRWDYNRLNLAFTQNSRVHSAAGTFPDKQTHGVAGTTTGGPANSTNTTHPVV
ncbi:hypothetical protein CI102_5511 [Trichoderma harzianum]|nr:hypothetical protein CI102_5511 [Trichoderma harzianum]